MATAAQKKAMAAKRKREAARRGTATKAKQKVPTSRWGPGSDDNEPPPPIMQWQAGSEVARELNIHLSQIYGYIKAGKVTNHKPTGEKGTLVDIEEVRAARDSSRRRGGKGAGAKHERPTVEEAAAQQTKWKRGDIVSYDKGQLPGFAPKGHAVAQVVGVQPRNVRLDGNVDGRSNYLFSTERLGVRLGKGLVHLENPTGLLGMIILQWVRDDKMELAEALEAWMEKHDVPVMIPELEEVVLEDDEVAAPTADEEDE